MATLVTYGVGGNHWCHHRTNGVRMSKWQTRTRLLGALLLILAAVQGAHADTPPDKWVSHCDGPYQLCGYLDRESGKVAIGSRFEVARPFSEELAAVRIDGRFGYIDRAGKVVIPPRFAEAGAFANGFAEVRLDGASGIIDRKGALVVPAEFARILPFYGKVFIARLLGPGNRNDARQLAGDLRTELVVLPIRSAGLYHADKGWLTPQDLSFSYFDDPQRGLVWAARRGDDGGEKWGLMNKDGSWHVPPRFSHVQRLVEGRAIVAGGAEESGGVTRKISDHLRGAVDADGRLVVPLQFRGLSYWRGGYGVGSMSGGPSGNGIVRPDGQLLGGRLFDDVKIPEDGGLPRARIGDRWYSVERDGRLVADQAAGSVALRCPGGLVLLNHGDKFEFHHEAITAPIGVFESIFQNRRACRNPVSVRRNGLWSFVTQDGRHIGGKGFENVYDFSGGYALVEVNGRWGIIDERGDFTVKPRLLKIRQERGAYLAQDAFGAEWIDGRGRKLDAPPRPEPDPGDVLKCQGGLRLFDRGGLWGLRDVTGKIVIQPKYRALSCFSSGIAWVVDMRRKAWCAIGPDGAARTSLDCKTTYYPHQLTHQSPQRLVDDPFENSVLLNRSYLDYGSRRRDKPPLWQGDFASLPKPFYGDLFYDSDTYVEKAGPAPGLTLLIIIGASFAIVAGALLLNQRRKIWGREQRS